MRALLLAAGVGSRLRPATDILPKCLMPIAGRPLLDIWFETLLAAGVDRLLVNMHHHWRAVERFVAGHPERARIDTVYEPALLNTGGSLLANRGFFGDASAILVHADNLSFADYTGFIARHERRDADVAITMLSFETDDPQSCGILELDGRGRVARFHEKVAHPPGNLANGAVYAVAPELFDFMAALGHPDVDFSLEVLPAYLGRIQTFANDDYHRDIGNIGALLKAQGEAGERLGAAVIPTDEAGLLEVVQAIADELAG